MMIKLIENKKEFKTDLLIVTHKTFTNLRM